MEVDMKGRVKGDQLRIRVAIDITKPICRGITLTMHGDEGPQWFSITYDRMPKFCYYCSLIGHTMEECEDKWDKSEYTL